MTSETSSLGEKTASGAFWTFLARLCQHGLQLIATTVLARLLTPSAYGVVGMATVITRFIAIFRSLGTASAIIQRKNLSPRCVSSLFWMNLVLSALTTIAAMSLSPLLGWIYREPQVTPVMFWLSLNFLFTGASSVHEALLSREMAFRKLCTIETVATVLQMAVSIAMAAMGYGVWSLVGGSLAMSLASSLMLVCAAGFIPKFQIDWLELKSTMGFSLNLSGFNVANYLSRNADSFLIGRYLGTAQLGYYQFAYNLMLFPVQNITLQLGRVLFPALAQMQDDSARLRNAYLRSCAIIALVTFPLMMGLLATAGPLVATLLGPQWSAVAPIITVLALVGMVQSIVVTVGYIYTTTGRTDLLLRTALATNLIILPSFVIGLRWGAYGVAVGYAVAFSVVSYFLFAYAFRLIDLKMNHFVAALSWPLRYSLTMFASVLGVRLALGGVGVSQPAAVLACSVATGVLVYGISLIVGKPPVLVDLFKSGALTAIPGMKRLNRLFA